MILGALCFMNRHEPDFDLVRRTMTGYVGTCRHCHAPVTRVGRHQWVKRDGTTDAAHAA